MTLLAKLKKIILIVCLFVGAMIGVTLSPLYEHAQRPVGTGIILPVNLLGIFRYCDTFDTYDEYLTYYEDVGNRPWFHDWDNDNEYCEGLKKE